MNCIGHATGRQRWGLSCVQSKYRRALSPNMDAQRTVDTRALQTDKDTKVTTGPLRVGSIAVNAVLMRGSNKVDKYDLSRSSNHLGHRLDR